MKVKMTMESNINIPRTMAKINDDGFQTFAAAEWHRLYSPFVPMNTGNLMETVIIRPFEIEHIMPYAGRVYETNMNYHKDKHPKASARWDVAAEPSQMPKLIQSMQTYVDNGGLRLGK